MEAFTSKGGVYSLGYILRKYNVFVENDFTGTHVVGPMVVGGKATASLGGSTTSERYPHDVPDYFGKVGGGKNITTVSDIPVYLGEEELGNTFTLVNGEGKNYFDYYFTSQFIDFGTAMAALQGEAEGFKGVDVDLTSKEKKDGYEISGSTVKLDVGGLYEFTAKELQNIQVLDIQGDFGGGSDTLRLLLQQLKLQDWNLEKLIM